MDTFRVELRPADPPAWSEPSSLARRFDLALFIGLVSLLVFAPLAFGSVEDWAILCLELGSIVSLFIWILKWVLTDAANPVVSPLWLPLAALALVAVIQIGFNLSSYRYATVAYSLQAAAYYFVFWTASQVFQSREARHRFSIAMSVFGFLVVFFAIVQSFSSPDKIYGFRAPRFGGYVYGPYVNHNHYAGLMEMLAPFPLVAALRRKLRVEKRALWGFAAFLMVASIFLSGSRGGMFSMTIEIAVLAAIFFGQNRNRSATLAGVTVLVLFLGFLFWLGSEQITQRLASLGQTTISSDARFRIAKDSLRMVADRPLLGWGLGTFALVYPHYRSFYTDDVVNAAHNDYLQFLAETGVVGFAAILWLLAGLVRAGVRDLRSWIRRRGVGSRAAAFIGALGIMCHSFTDFNLQIPANAMMFFALCALASAESRPNE
jgi:O-antigen ligase